MIKDVRFRSEKYTRKIISEDLYKKWIEKYPEYSKYSYKEFSEYWKLLSNKHTDTVSTNSHGVKLQLNLGEIALKYTSSQDLNRNYHSSTIAKEPVGHLNFGSSGKNGKIVWSIAYVRKINSELPLIAFQACRNFTVKAAKAFSETPELFKISKASKMNILSIQNNYKENSK